MPTSNLMKFFRQAATSCLLQTPTQSQVLLLQREFVFQLTQAQFQPNLQLGSSGDRSENFHGVSIGPFSKLLAAKILQISHAQWDACQLTLSAAEIEIPVRMQVKKYFVKLLISQNLDDNGIKITFYDQKLSSLFGLKLHN